MKLKQILNNRKGFTLMEIIVVLIIIAVLAAALIPSFVGFIRDSRSATVLNEARMGMNAAQVLLTEYRGAEGTGDNPFDGATFSATTTGPDARFWELLDGDVQPAGEYSDITVTDNRVTGLVYTTGDGNTGNGSRNGWEITIADGIATVTERGT